MYHFVINSKNYPETSGSNALRLSRLVDSTQQKYSMKKGRLAFHLALPSYAMSLVSKSYPKLDLFAQHLDAKETGSSTGYQVPEIARSFGASGSILNHSEHRIDYEQVKALVVRLRNLSMKSIVCARTPAEVRKFGELAPDYIAIEPPDLIGSGNAVSKAKPQLISASSEAIEEANKKSSFESVLLCGAGIVEEEDSAAAVRLGASGILVASGVVKSQNWSAKINSLARGMICKT